MTLRRCVWYYSIDDVHSLISAVQYSSVEVKGCTNAKLRTKIHTKKLSWDGSDGLGAKR